MDGHQPSTIVPFFQLGGGVKWAFGTIGGFFVGEFGQKSTEKDEPTPPSKKKVEEEWFSFLTSLETNTPTRGGRTNSKDEP